MPAARRPGLRRAVGLFRSFRVEQSRPALFYGLLAADTVDVVGRHTALAGARLLDVGGGPGYFADAFRRAGARYAAVDADAGELARTGSPPPGTLQASGLALPIVDEAVDVCFSSNVLEHVPDPWRMMSEMLRVTRPGGVVLVSFTTWFGPWGGHETSPWHYLGGGYARSRYARRHDREPKNRFGESLFAVRVAPVLRWARCRSDAELVAAYPRYHPWWAAWVVHVPLLRELTTWNLVVVLKKRIAGRSHPR